VVSVNVGLASWLTNSSLDLLDMGRTMGKAAATPNSSTIAGLELTHSFAVYACSFSLYPVHRRGMMMVAWAEDRETVEMDPSADPGAVVKGGVGRSPAPPRSFQTPWPPKRKTHLLVASGLVVW
jgi:hypothetical protein